MRKPAVAANDPLAPIRRMSQAEKIAFFSVAGSCSRRRELCGLLGIAPEAFVGTAKIFAFRLISRSADIKLARSSSRAGIAVKTKIIVNPMANKGNCGKRWPQIRAELEKRISARSPTTTSS